jgi:hypothetical protein
MKIDHLDLLSSTSHNDHDDEIGRHHDNIIQKNAMVELHPNVMHCSTYEMMRIQKIVRNHAKLRSLGLMTQQEEEQSNADATRSLGDRSNHTRATTKTLRDTKRHQKRPSQWKVKMDTMTSRSKRCKDTAATEIIPLSKTSSSSSVASNPRTSLRLKGLPPVPITQERYKEGTIDMEPRIWKSRQERQQIAIQYATSVNEPTTSSSSSNKTATYEHCDMRIRTMSDQQIQNRIRVIERAAGQHCIVKMKIMVQCLLDHQMHELAQMASEALQRLEEVTSI